MRRSGSAAAGSIFWGLAFVALGTVLLLDNLEVLRMRDAIRWMALAIRDLWPILFVAIGIGMIADGVGKRRGPQAAEPGVGS
jgi:hypothetical protein